MRTKAIPLEDPSRFTTDLTWSKGKKENGIYTLDANTKCKYTIPQQASPTAKYTYRGMVSLLASNGKIFNHKGKPTQQEVYGNTPDEMRNRIVGAAKKLHVKYGAGVTAVIAKTYPVEQRTLASSIISCGDKYIQGTYKETQQSKYRSQLKRLGAELGNVKLEKMSNRKIEQVCENLGVNWQNYLKIGAKFVAYLYSIEHGTNSYTNPFQKYLEDHPAPSKKNVRRLQSKAVNPSTLTVAQSNQLSQYVKEKQEEDPYWTGLSLVKDAGLTTAEAVGLKWKDIYFFPSRDDYTHLEYNLSLVKHQTLYIHLQKNEVAGATHNYTFPLLAQCKQAMVQRYIYLKSIGLTPEELLEKPILTVAPAVNTKLQSGKLASFCRGGLKNITKISNSELNQNRDKGNGAGVVILRNTYTETLRKYCGLDNDPAMIKFLQHQSLTNSVQASHYRSFSDVTAHDFMAVAMRRTNNQFLSEGKKRKHTVKEEDGQQKLNIVAQNPREKLAATATVVLQPGEVLQVTSMYGCKVHVAPVVEDDETEED